MASQEERVLSYERRLREFSAIVRGAQRDIARQVVDAIRSGDLDNAFARRRQLAAVVRVLEQLGQDIDPLARRLIAEAAKDSAQVTANQIGRLNIVAPAQAGVFQTVNGAAVLALQDTIVGRLSDSRRLIGRQVEDVYAKAGRRAALRAVLGADGSSRTAARSLAMELLKDQQVKRLVTGRGVGFVDKAGRGWSMDSYAEMVVRTTTRQAVVEGSLARMAAHGINLARVSVHGDPCKICAPFQGRLVSLTGESTEYEGEAAVSLGSLPNGGPPFHPNCKHTLAPVSVFVESIRRQLAA